MRPMIVALLVAGTSLDAQRIADQSTFEQAARPSTGVKDVLVNGVAVVRDGRPMEGIDGVAPGRAVRAPVR